MDIIGYETLYSLTYTGVITNLKNNKIVKQTINNAGYSYVKLTKDGKQKTKYIHKLLAEHFLPNPNQYKFVGHKYKKKNKLDNIYWTSKDMIKMNPNDLKLFGFYLNIKYTNSGLHWKLDYKLDGRRVQKTYKIYEEALYYSKLARESIKMH